MTASCSRPLIYISKSALEHFLRCPLSWYYTYVLGARPLIEDKLDAWRGNVIHAGLLVGLFKGDGTLDNMYHHAERHPDFPKLSKVEKLRVNAMLAAAHQVFVPVLDRWGPPTMAEEKLVRDDGDVRYTIVADALWPTFAFELKSTKSRCDAKSDYWGRASVNRQPWFYMDELEKHGHTVDYIDWQVMKVPLEKKRTWHPGQSELDYVTDLADELADDTDKWFPQFEIPNHDTTRAWHRAQIDKIVRMMRFCIENMEEPPGDTGSCYDFRRLCSFAPVCHQGRDINDKKLYQLRKDRP